MAIELGTPGVGELGQVIGALRDWQDEGLPTQLHPGDLGWCGRFGPEVVAAALRTWSRDGQVLAIGFLDGPDVVRLTVAPRVWREDELAHRVVADVSEPERGVLPAGKVAIETPDRTRVRELLDDGGWSVGEPWTPFRRDLAEPVEPTGLRVEVITSGRESAFTALHRAAWHNPRFTDELWRLMVDGYADVHCLLGYDGQGVAVAGATVWSAGPGKPGLLEPVGVHPGHRGHGYGRMISIAAAAELRKLGSSSAEVCTRSANTAAVATYRAAGFGLLPERLDRTRDA
jgi:GNAT superfamily N-acetyltransferase